MQQPWPNKAAVQSLQAAVARCTISCGRPVPCVWDRPASHSTMQCWISAGNGDYSAISWTYGFNCLYVCASWLFQTLQPATQVLLLLLQTLPRQTAQGDLLRQAESPRVRCRCPDHKQLGTPKFGRFELNGLMSCGRCKLKQTSARASGPASRTSGVSC